MGLKDNFINTYRELCEEVTSNFTARRKPPKMLAELNVIIQGGKKTLWEYVERFTREGVEVYGANENLKWFIFENNIREECKF